MGSDVMFTFKELGLKGLILVGPEKHFDVRGSLSERYDKPAFESAGITEEFTKDLATWSKKGVIRGLHFQRKPHEQAKLVSVLSGRIFDVAVDIREGSATFGKWIGTELNESNGLSLFVPKGFAHGFQALEDSTVLYKISGEYSREHESGIIWNDPKLKIPWKVANPVVSAKDKLFPGLGRE